MLFLAKAAADKRKTFGGKSRLAEFLGSRLASELRNTLYLPRTRGYSSAAMMKMDIDMKMICAIIETYSGARGHLDQIRCGPTAPVIKAWITCRLLQQLPGNGDCIPARRDGHGWPWTIEDGTYNDDIA